jgi:hypothetical protein
MIVASNSLNPVRITFFPDSAAATKREETICPNDLADRIINTSAASKGGLPWLKLSTFGEIRSDKHSLRNNENVLTISGIEADYDQERVSFDDAGAILTEAGVAALVYTSPSHTAATPRWRVLCQFSKPMPPEQRDLYMARLNGLFGGIFARESWTLSQSYYFGSINHNPDHQAETIDGTPIDLMGELDAAAIGKPETKAGNGRANERPAGSGAGSYVPASDVRLEAYRLAVLDTLRRQAIDGEKHHALLRTALALGGIQPEAGFTDAQAIQWLMDALPASVVDWNAAKQTAAWGLEQGRQKPLQLDDRPWRGNGSHPPPEPPPAADEAHDASQKDEPQAEPPPDDTAEDGASLRKLLSIESWAERDIPPPDRLLGDLITKTTRMFLIGRTGLGKTLLGLAIAAGVASGRRFLHWRSSRPARVVYLDGEMPAELIKPRAIDAMRRLGVPIPAENLLIFGRDIEAEARRVCPSLPPFAPLNTDEGQLFMVALLAAIGDVDVIIFDNVMSLIAGDMKDEIPWSDVLPLVSRLTDRQIGQLWLDHTGHNTDRQYGSSTKAWRFDTVGVMAPLTEEKADPRVTAFTLSFDYPGKARRRTPDNWTEFQTQTIRLTDDQWTGEPVDQQASKKASRLGPKALAQYRALADALVVSPTPGRTTRDAWYAECVRLGLEKPVPSDAVWAVRDRLEKGFRTRVSDLKVAGRIGVDGDIVTDLDARR